MTRASRRFPCTLQTAIMRIGEIIPGTEKHPKVRHYGYAGARYTLVTVDPCK